VPPHLCPSKETKLIRHEKQSPTSHEIAPKFPFAHNSRSLVGRARTYFRSLFKLFNAMQEQILSLKSFGARLRVKDGLFEVTVPDLSGAGEHRIHQFAPPTVTSILLHRHTSVSADALMLAEQNGVLFAVLDEHDHPALLLAGLHPAGSLDIWKRQIALNGTAQGLGFARDWLCLKIQRKLKWLAKLKGYRKGEALRAIEDCEKLLQEYLLRMKAQTLHQVAKSAETLRGLEGSAQRAYLQTLSFLLPSHLQFEGRSKRPSADLFNALLNYAYGILYRRLEKILWGVGLNPYFGFLHGDTRKQKNFLFDFIESYRPWMDKIVFKLCSGKEVSSQHVRELEGGGLWLNDEGRKLLTDAVEEYFKEKKETIDERNFNLWQMMELEARAFIRLLLPRDKDTAEVRIAPPTAEI
jgi:CRISPR-associated protein Cas1